MLDENEPNAGAIGPDGETTEQTTVTRRRRAASRPAGPPPELPEQPVSAPATALAAQAAPSVTEGRSVPSTAAAQRAAGTPDEPPASASGTSAAGASGLSGTSTAVGTPAAAGVSGTSATEPQASDVSAEAVVSPVEEAVAAAVEADKPKRGARTRSTVTTTRRRTSKKAEEAAADGAAGVQDALSGADSAAQAAGVAESPADAGAVEGGEQAAEEAPARRRRTRKKPEAELDATRPSAESAEADLAGAERAGTGGASAARAGTVPADEAVAAQAAAGVGEAAARRAGGADADEDILEILPEDEPLDDEPAGEDLDEEDKPNLLSDPFGLTVRRQDQPGTAFQRPAAIFAPLFQAPDPTQAKPVRPEPQPQVQPEPVAEVSVETAEEAGAEDESDLDGSDEQDDEGGSRRRRRRRGGRGRGKSRERDDAEDDGEDAEDGEEEGEEEQPEESQEEGTGSRRRRRRRRRGSDEEVAEPAGDDPPNTVVRIRAPRSGRAASQDVATDGVTSVRGSTRLEAKKQRRREGRELGRRRPPIITESEFLARRESVDRMMVVRRTGDRTQIAVLEDGVLVEHYVNREASQSYVGNVYLGKVQNVLPSMEAAFVDIGKGRNAVLYAGEVNFDTAGMEGQPKRIESALKSGQSVLVQVTKDPIGHKGARLTSQISLPGRYLVYVPDGSMTGISRKLPDKERTRLKSILKKVMPENAGVIVRTAAEGASEEELARDVARLSAQWEAIQKKAKNASPPELLSAEPDLTVRVVRDVFNEDFTSLVVQGEDAWETVDEYVQYVAPHLGERLSKWDGEQGDVFESYRIDEQLGKAMERKVWLPSGGSLVIDRTEAMTVVDVNTGKFTGQGGNLEETVTRNNLEAAEEIVRQLRLRDIGGIIVIDFIDMVLESNRDLVLRRMLECLARDRTKHQVAEVTSLGLVQMTRKRVGQGLLEAFSTPCDCCNGRGLIVSTEPVEHKPEPRGTQGKMAVEKAVSEKVSAAKDSAGRDTVTDALEDVPAEDDQAGQTSGRGRRRSRRARSGE
ncbi:Rne/Rng family ribonuclease [Nonomuraea glycinis]|uniref:Rne/Rng family ribonuclease n=1 Tax=Nonomuraea glycinis TaxID=2047744 RepID=UPI0033A6C64C